MCAATLRGHTNMGSKRCGPDSLGKNALRAIDRQSINSFNSVNLPLALVRLRRKRALLPRIIHWRLTRRKRRRRFSQKAVHAERKERGEFTRIIQHYRAADPEEHYGYFRMYKEQFDFILSKISDKISHQPTHRMPVSAEERLSITLR